MNYEEHLKSLSSQETATIPHEMVQQAIKANQQQSVPTAVKILAVLGVFFLILTGGFAAWL
jgi:type III secretory pathway component EscS